MGPKSEEIGEALLGLPVTIAINSQLEGEMAGSVRTGLLAVRKSSSGILICLSDHPLASAQTLKLLITAHRDDPDRIFVPLYGGKGGHPSLFPKKLIEEIFTGINLRDILRRNPNRVEYVAVADEGIILDMDTAEDYQRIHEKLKNQSTNR